MEDKKVKIIGRTTFGIALILFGITIAVQTLLPIDILRFVLMVWPLIIVSIGVEIVYYSNKEDVVTKYDFLGIILTGLIILSGICFSILNYGVNKIFYSDELSKYINEEKEYTISRYFDSNLNILSLDDKAIKLRIIEDSSYTDDTKATIKYNYKLPEDSTIFDLFNSSPNDYSYYINTYNLEKEIATLELSDSPDNYTNIEIIVVTSSKDKITTNGKFEII